MGFWGSEVGEACGGPPPPPREVDWLPPNERRLPRPKPPRIAAATSKTRSRRRPMRAPTYPAGLLVAYTDGTTFRENPGPMAWAVVYIRDGKVERTECGALYRGTNNRAELLAAIWALERETQEDLLIVSDSLYVINHATGRWSGWANPDLWERFERALARRRQRGLRTTFQHVRGHGTDPFNHLADTLARSVAAEAAACVHEAAVAHKIPEPLDIDGEQTYPVYETPVVDWGTNERGDDAQHTLPTDSDARRGDADRVSGA